MGKSKNIKIARSACSLLLGIVFSLTAHSVDSSLGGPNALSASKSLPKAGNSSISVRTTLNQIIDFGVINGAQSNRIIKDIQIDNPSDSIGDIYTDVQVLSEQCKGNRYFEIKIPKNLYVPAGQSVIIPVILTSKERAIGKLKESILCRGEVSLRSQSMDSAKYQWIITIT